jgi:hypothetical protein
MVHFLTLNLDTNTGLSLMTTAGPIPCDICICSLYELWFGTKPDVSHIQVWGCAYVDCSMTLQISSLYLVLVFIS